MEQISTQIAIVGAGPSGLATANGLQQAGYDVVVLDKGQIAAHVDRFPTYMRFFSTPDLLELPGFPLIVTNEKPTKQEYLQYLRRFVVEKQIDIRLFHEVSSIEGEKGDFRVLGKNRLGDDFELHAEIVVLATGSYATPKPLNVPGEDLPKVRHYFSDVHEYFGSKVLVVGGKNSAVEAALLLFRAGVEVALCHRRAQVGPVKYWVQPDIENRIAKGEIPAYMPAHIMEIKPASVVIEQEGRPPVEIENDFVLALTGYQPNPDFLHSLGIRTAAEDGRPAHNPNTLETERPGLYMVGEMLAGRVSGEIFIENSRTHVDSILGHLRNGGR